MNNLPVFYSGQAVPDNGLLMLEEDTSRHVIQVLRMKQGEKLQLTDGRGNLYTTEITSEHKKGAQVKILSNQFHEPSVPAVAIAISLVKNAGRFEWFLEKATEIGISEIIPLLCSRTEKQHFRADRMKNILTSAMLQSRQAWLPRLHEPTKFEDAVQQCRQPQRFIAHCLEISRQSITKVYTGKQDAIMLIGPEGDFTLGEIDLALQQQFLPVTLGDTRLRTETAGIVAATLLKGR